MYRLPQDDPPGSWRSPGACQGDGDGWICGTLAAEWPSGIEKPSVPFYVARAS